MRRGQRTATGLLCALLLAGCVTEQAGHEQALLLRVEGSLPEEVQSARVVIGAAELRPCEDAVATAGQRLWQWLVPKAHAHSESNALRIGVPQRVALEDGELELGRFQAPIGEYCEVGIELSPADMDAAGLGLDGGVGETLTVSFVDGRPPLRSTSRASVALALPEAMEIAGPPREHRVTVELSLAAWPVHEFRDGESALAALNDALSVH